VALRENQLIRKGPSTLLYRSDTAPGSSGSPCFNDAWQVWAQHMLEPFTHAACIQLCTCANSSGGNLRHGVES
jgi:hypothetical protein